MKTIKCKCGRLILIDDDFESKWLLTRWDCRNNRGAITNNGYSFAWLVIGEPELGQTVDHINHDTHDNRRENLRLVTFSVNNQNRPPGRNNKTGYKGVHFVALRGKYTAQIKSSGCNKHLGYFDTAEKAAVAYNLAAVSIFGANAYQNQIKSQPKQ